MGGWGGSWDIGKGGEGEGGRDVIVQASWDIGKGGEGEWEREGGWMIVGASWDLGKGG